MATARLGRMARPLLRAAMSSSEEGKRHGGGPVVVAAKAGASSWFGELSRSAGRTGGASREGPESRAAAMAEAVLGQGERRKWRNLGHGSSLGGSLGRFSTTGARAAGRAAMKVKSLDHVVLTVKNIEATCEFYSEVLGMEVVRFSASDGGTRVALAFGEQKINLHEVGKEFEPKAHRATAGSADLCFITDAPLDGMQKHIESSGVSILQGPVGRTGALGAIRSVYFRDPDLNLIEVSNYV